MNRRLPRPLAWSRAALLGAFFWTGVVTAQTLEQADFFEKRVYPVLAEKCFVCHSEAVEQPMSGLRLDSIEGMLHGGDRGPALIPGNASASLLIQAVRQQKLAMPPTGKLADVEIAALEQWVQMGAPWPKHRREAARAPVDEVREQGAEHWAFQPYHGGIPPETGDDWPATPIDEFVLRSLREQGLTPSPRASPRVLLRRLSYDLTGLPPTREEMEAAVADLSPSAYEQAVDRLLASEHFGERWARHWLDLARYAEAGAANVRFSFAYTYRDWVIQALNDDMPYDRFVTLQLAADKLPGEEERHLAALGFLTLGLDPFRRANLPDKIDDRIDVVTRGLMGLSVSCARCHDHKFDPIPTEDYYSLYGVFANTEEPLEPVLIENVSRRGPPHDFYESRLQLRRDILREFEASRLEEHRAEARAAASMERYLLAAWKGRAATGPQLETLSREQNLNFHLLQRWRDYLRAAVEADDPIFVPWAEFATRFEDGLAKPSPATPGTDRSDARANPRVVEELRSQPPSSLEELAARYAELLARADAAKPHPNQDREALRQVLRGKGMPPNIPEADFWQVQTEGDKNTINRLVWWYRSMAAEYAYRAAPRHAMSARDSEKIETSHVFVRGDQNNIGRPVPRRFLRTLSGSDRQPFHNGSGRLELALAIADEKNPLTARVIVNRVWHHLFGKGLVETTSDFGTRGAPPTHPELLDYLAATFVEDDWSIKRLIRRIVHSNVYQQSSTDRPEARSVDPQNRLLWRMNRRRLDFEALRDSLLAVAGRLDRTVGGPSFLLGAQPSVPRRTLYSLVERERTLPEFRSFDMADPEQHTPQRHLTTVPQQALFMMNSSFMVEQARHVVQPLEDEAAASAEARIQALYDRIFGRSATMDEVELGLRVVRAPTKEPSVPGEGDEADPPASIAWRYGTGEFDPAAGRVKSFRPFEYFSPVVPIGFGTRLEDAWKGSSLLPDREQGAAHLTASGGAPGDDLSHSVIRRWVSPIDGKVTIAGKLSHQMDQFAERFEQSNGIRGWIVSDRSGTLASWTLRDMQAETGLSGISVAKGEILDFVVDSRDDYEADGFSWAPAIEQVLEAEDSEKDKAPRRRWRAKEDFRGPVAKPLSPWEQYAQVLLQTNEFTFLD